MSASATYIHAEQNLVHGYLEDAQRESEESYRRFLYSDPSWSRRFQLLAATAMSWRGLNEDSLNLLADGRVSSFDPSDRIQQLSIEAPALSSLHRFTEADRILTEADALCANSSSAQCGPVLRAHGFLSLERGETEEAEKAFLASLNFARASKDGMLESTSLLDLGSVASQRERHDEASVYYQLAAEKSYQIGATSIQESALGNEGWEQYTLGNFDKALEIFAEAERRASSLSDLHAQAVWLTAAALIYADTGQLVLAERSDIAAIYLARRINQKQGVVNASEDISRLYIDEGRPDEADKYLGEALVLAQDAGNIPDILYCHMLQGEAAALRHNWTRADGLLHEVISAPESQTRMRWTAQHSLATMYQTQGQAVQAEESYKAAITLVEGARADLKQEVSQLTFLTNAASIYDDYIGFLVGQGRMDEALEAADWSRARTLQQGLKVIPAGAALKPSPLRAREIARKANATLLFYWLGQKKSYLWAVSPEKTTLVSLPAKSEIVTRMQRYRRTLLALKDPLRENGGQGDKDGRELYEMLVAPAGGAVSAERPVVLFTDGEMTQLNFETLLVGGTRPHYWIEDATVLSAPSIRLFAAKNKPANAAHDNLLLLGDAASTDVTLPHLPMAALEVSKVEGKFMPSERAVFSGTRATPLTYLQSKPEQYSFIHFVAHGTASSTDPLESAVILSRDSANEDSYKLYAREILKHPISARLVTISACNSSGTRSYAGEGVIGLSWAFLRAGAHNTIGALWDVSDASTPGLMETLYSGLKQNKPPAQALREAKLALLHSNGNFSRPFYWAPFQLYSGH